jgi:hypothetical protein
VPTTPVPRGGSDTHVSRLGELHRAGPAADCGDARTRGWSRRYLLTGFSAFSACGVCGGSLGVKARRPGTGLLDYRYVYHATRGPEVCANRYTLPVRVADAEIVATIQRDC